MSRRITTVTILTPSGRGAVATVSVQGPQAVEFVQQCFTAASGKRLVQFPLRRIVFGRWISTSCPGEESVVCRLEDERVEVHCHGGATAVEAVVSSLESRGATRLLPDDWFCSTESDIIAVEARAALANAKAERTALILLDQYHGALRREVEITIDGFARGDIANAQSKLARLSQLSKTGQHLATPWRVAIVGPPNVGKSSLMNALVGYSRSIVFDQPGTTRDLVRAETAFDGWPVELIDTAGLRESHDAIESEGIERAEQAMVSADLCLRIHDALQVPDRRMPRESSLPSAVPELEVYNKMDLMPAGISFVSPGPQVSAKTGQGLLELTRLIVQSLVGFPPAPGDAIPFTSRQTALVDQALQTAEENRQDRAIALLRQLITDD